MNVTVIKINKEKTTKEKLDMFFELVRKYQVESKGFKHLLN